MLARDPDRLTVGWSGPEIPDWAGLMIAAEEIQRGSILSADEMGHAVIARPSSPTWNFAGIAINSADGGEIVTVKKRGVFDIHVDISLSVGAFVK